MRVTNKGSEPVWFRDDAGKHSLKRGQSLEVTGDQHLTYILSLPGVVVQPLRPRRASAPELDEQP
jgi:hypothetical protein